MESGSQPISGPIRTDRHDFPFSIWKLLQPETQHPGQGSRVQEVTHDRCAKQDPPKAAQQTQADLRTNETLPSVPSGLEEGDSLGDKVFP